jgi:hypothetical protein
MICDLAETYHIYNWRAVDLQTLAILVTGLREDSRVKTKLSGSKVPLNTLLLASAVDRLSLLLWAQSKDGQKGINRPKMIVDILNGEEEKTKVKAFRNGADFTREWNRLLRR